MAPIDENTAVENPTRRGQTNEGELPSIKGYDYEDEEVHSSTLIDQSTTSANTQDQTLLRALQDLIICVMKPKQTNGMSSNNKNTCHIRGNIEYEFL
jgi:hypothetical protein